MKDSENPSIAEAMIDAELEREDADPAPNASRRRGLWIIAAVVAVAIVAAGIGAWAWSSRAPEPFTVKADMSMGFYKYGILTMTPSDCDLVRTSKGTWRSSTPVIFRQDDTEVGTGEVSSNLEPIEIGMRMCMYQIVGKISPVSNETIVAELPDGGTWAQSPAEWKANNTHFAYELSLDSTEAIQ